MTLDSPSIDYLHFLRIVLYRDEAEKTAVRWPAVSFAVGTRRCWWRELAPTMPEGLATGAKGRREKLALAWRICQHTSVSRRWLSERLALGHPSRVTHALGIARK